MGTVQFGAAVAIRKTTAIHAPEADVVVAAFDRRLLEAAEREGFITLGGPLASQLGADGAASRGRAAQPLPPLLSRTV